MFRTLLGAARSCRTAVAAGFAAASWGIAHCDYTEYVKDAIETENVPSSMDTHRLRKDGEGALKLIAGNNGKQLGEEIGEYRAQCMHPNPCSVC